LYNGDIQQPFDALHEREIHGLSIEQDSVTPDDKVTVRAGRCRSDDDKLDLILTADKTADMTAASGLGGIDDGGRTADTWYYLWVVGDSGLINDTDVLLSASATAPILPGTHDMKRRIGCVFNQAGTPNTIRKFLTHRSPSAYLWDTPLLVLNAGPATTFANVSMANFVPKHHCYRAILRAVFASFGAVGSAYVRPARDTATDWTDAESQVARSPVAGELGIGSFERWMENRPLIAVDPALEYKVTNGTLDIYLLGFEFIGRQEID